MSSDNLVLCAASAYEEKFYLNEAFKGLPEGIKEDLKIISVLFTNYSFEWMWLKKICCLMKLAVR